MERRRSVGLTDTLEEINRSVGLLRERIRRFERSERRAPAAPAAFASPPSTPGQSPLERADDLLAVVPSSPSADVITAVLARAVGLLDVDRAMLFLLDDRSGRLLPKGARGFRRGDVAEIALARGDGLIGRAFVEDRLVRSSGEGLAEDPFVARFPVAHAAAAPVRAAGQPVGVLFVGRHQRRGPLGPTETLLLAIAADRVGTAVAHERATEDASLHADRMQEIETFSRAMLAGSDEQDLLRRGCEAASRVVRGAWAVAAFRAPSGGLTVVAASSGVALGAVPWSIDGGQGLAAEVLASGEVVACPDITTRGRVEEVLRALGTGACLVVPLPAGGETVGLLYIGDPRPRAFSRAEIDAGRTLAALIGTAVTALRAERAIREERDQALSSRERIVQSEKARALAEMAGGIAHEFNNILAIILGKTQLMLARAPEESIREGLGLIEEAGWRAADIVRRLQGFAATGVEEVTGQADLGAVVEDALAQGRWRDEAGGAARGARIDVVQDVGDVPPVRGDAVALREVVVNLVQNAVDAMPGGGRVSVSTRRVGEWAQLVVKDTGEGMTEDVRRRVFEPFFTTRTPLRTGLGLSVVHGIVLRHRGRVEVESEPGLGATFTVWLPLAPAPDRPPEVSPAPAAGKAGSVLVLAEDEPICLTLVAALGEAGYRVDWAADAPTGLARLEAGRFDVVLADLSLPGGSGLDIARLVKRIRPETSVVLMTGWGHLLDPARLREHGVDLMLVKPFRTERVLAVVGEAFRLRSAR